ncbi:hypothetical protein [Halorubrum distributum]|uniref:hypothetical protein n=1 Tax=Halorubrum distributum TaxID=29283 RepID=UPI0012674D10|nr:hypothetical protein [Halorubrum distributum]
MSTVEEGTTDSQEYVVETLLLSAVVLAVPFYGWALFRFGSFPVGRPDLLAIGLLTVYVSMSVLFRHRVQIDIPSLLLLGWIAEIIGVGVWISLTGRHILDFTTVFLQLVLLVGTYVAVVNVRVSENSVVALVRLWVLSAISMALFGFYQGVARIFSLPLAYLKFNIPKSGTIQRAGYDTLFPDVLRVASVFAEPSWYGAHLLPPTVLCLVLVAQDSRKTLFRSRWSLVGATAILVGGVVQSASITAYITLLGALLMYVVPVSVYRGPFRFRHVLSATTAGALVVASVPILRLVALELVELSWEIIVWLQTGNEAVLSFASATVRLTNNYQALQYWASLDPVHMLFGQGLNSITNTSAVQGTSSSNSYLQLLVDTGAVGAGLFILFITYLFCKLVVTPREHSSRTRVADLGVALAGSVLAGAMILFQTGHIRPARWCSFLLAGLFLVTVNRSKFDDTGRTWNEGQ